MSLSYSQVILCPNEWCVRITSCRSTNPMFIIEEAFWKSLLSAFYLIDSFKLQKPLKRWSFFWGAVARWTYTSVLPPKNTSAWSEKRRRRNRGAADAVLKGHLIYSPPTLEWCARTRALVMVTLMVSLTSSTHTHTLTYTHTHTPTNTHTRSPSKDTTTMGMCVKNELATTALL